MYLKVVTDEGVKLEDYLAMLRLQLDEQAAQIADLEMRLRTLPTPADQGELAARLDGLQSQMDNLHDDTDARLTQMVSDLTQMVSDEVESQLSDWDWNTVLNDNLDMDHAVGEFFDNNSLEVRLSR